jgi:hypothetical protein
MFWGGLHVISVKKAPRERASKERLIALSTEALQPLTERTFVARAEEICAIVFFTFFSVQG